MERADRKMPKSKRPRIRELRAKQTILIEKMRELTKPLFQDEDLRALWTAYLDAQDWFAPPTRKMLVLLRCIDAGAALIERAAECGELDLASTCLECVQLGSNAKEALTKLRQMRYLTETATSQMFNA
jgi:hypothetical protein